MFMPKWLRGSMLTHTGAGYRNQSMIDVPVPYLVSLPRQFISAPLDNPRTNLIFLMACTSRNKARHTHNTETA
jgi:hypothetical protein